MIDPQDHPSAGSGEPDAEDGTVRIVRQVLRAQLSIVLREGASVTLPDAVPAVHDYRVAMRRTRVALKVYRPFLPKRARELQNGLASLAEVTGPVRDLDVLAQRVRGERADSPAAQARSQSLIHLLDKHREAARIQLEKQLARPRYARMLDDWTDLSSEVPEPGPEALERSIEAFAAVTLREAQSVFNRLVAAAAEFDDYTDDDRIHELRIEAKRLRYLLEFVSSVAPSSRVAEFIFRLKRLQDRLGAYQDLRIQAARLRKLAKTPGAPIEARLEAIRLAARWNLRRLRSRRGVEWALLRFTGATNRRRLHRLGPVVGSEGQQTIADSAGLDSSAASRRR